MISLLPIKIPVSNDNPIAKIKIVRIGEMILKKNSLSQIFSLQKGNTLEIVKPIKLYDEYTKISSVNVLTGNWNPDSVYLRIRFYEFDRGIPGKNLFNKDILEKVEINRGLVTIDIKRYNVLLKGKVFLSTEFIPTNSDSCKIPFIVNPITDNKTLSRIGETLEWKKSPYQYQFFVTAEINSSFFKKDEWKNFKVLGVEFLGDATLYAVTFENMIIHKNLSSVTLRGGCEFVDLGGSIQSKNRFFALFGVNYLYGRQKMHLVSGIHAVYNLLNSSAPSMGLWYSFSLGPRLKIYNRCFLSLKYNYHFLPLQPSSSYHWGGCAFEFKI